MNSYVSCAWQGILQGLTEYLPVSSSGHLTLFQYMSGFSGPALSFDLLLHLATLIVTVVYFSRDIISLLSQFCSGFVSQRGRQTEGWRYGWAVIAGTVITGILGLSLKGFVEQGTSLTVLGLCWLVTAALCELAVFLPEKNGLVTLKIGLIVGLVQGIAVLPGISRSGSTIVCALLLGLSRKEAFRFSFLLSLPAIAGAALLELKDVVSGTALPQGAWFGFILAFVFGFIALILLRQMVAKGRWTGFAVYCAGLGIATLFFM